VTDDPGFGLAFFKYPVTKSNGAAADLKYTDLHLDIVPITKRAAEIRLHINGGKANTMGLHHVMILNSQLTSKDFLQNHMKIVHKSGIIDNACPVDVTKPNFEL
jgi:hypothetical protein